MDSEHKTAASLKESLISGNLLALPPATGEQEHIDVLLEAASARVERIVSRGQPSPEGFWYDQTHDEWEALLKGTATLFFADHETINLVSGDYLLIPAHRKHRVERTSEDALWWAVHFNDSEHDRELPCGVW